MATDEQILKVKQNIRNMIDFNNYLQTQGNTKILNAYALLSLSDNKDLGLQVGLNLLCGSFWALGGPYGAVGAIAANFLSGMVGSYAVSKPPSLQAQISSLLSRFQATSEQANADLELIYGDPEQYWNTSYSGQVNTPFGTHTAAGTVSQPPRHHRLPSPDRLQFHEHDLHRPVLTRPVHLGPAPPELRDYQVPPRD